MRRNTWLLALGLASAPLVGVAGRAPDSSGQPPQGTPSPRTGLFTEAQATRAGPAFERSWSGGSPDSLAPRRDERSDLRVTLDDLFFVLRTTMPPNGTSTVSMPDRAAVFAFILKTNGYTASRTTLTADTPQLKQQRLEVTATGASAPRPEPPAFVPGAAGAVPAASGPDQTTLNAASASTDWLFHNHDYAGTSHSPLDAISAENASRLTPVCAFQMGERDNFQTGPIVHDGEMSVTTMTTTIALDAATCRVKWRHTWQTKDDTGWQRNRGVAIKDGRVVRATPDGYLLGLSTSGQGDNLYTNSLVVLDVRTGKLRWYRQLIQNDSHDWDVTHVTSLITAAVNGAPRRLVTTAGKDGMLRAIDRDSKDVVYEAAVTTRENADIPVGLTPIRACPGVLGGVEWNGPAFNPGTNLLYVPAVDWCATFVAFEQVRHIPGKLYLGGDANLDPASKAQGWVTAVDASTGEVRWKYRSPRPMVAAVTTTAGNVVFTGELTGDFVTLDARTGDVLYRFNTGGPMGGGIATYATGGRQYVAAASGSPSNFWVDRNPGSPTIFVFALPR